MQESARTVLRARPRLEGLDCPTCSRPNGGDDGEASQRSERSFVMTVRRSSRFHLVSCSRSTLADNGRMMLPIEPLSQGDRENFQLLLFRLTSTQARVNFCSPRISLGERKNHEH